MLQIKKCQNCVKNLSFIIQTISLIVVLRTYQYFSFKKSKSSFSYSYGLYLVQIFVIYFCIIYMLSNIYIFQKDRITCIFKYLTTFFLFDVSNQSYPCNVFFKKLAFLKNNSSDIFFTTNLQEVYCLEIAVDKMVNT